MNDEARSKIPQQRQSVASVLRENSDHCFIKQ